MLRDLGYPHKTIFLVPPVSRKERQRRLSVLADECGIPWEAVDTDRTGRGVLAVCFPLGAPAPLVIVSGGPDDVDYDVADAASDRDRHRCGQEQ